MQLVQYMRCYNNLIKTP